MLVEITGRVLDYRTFRSQKGDEMCGLRLMTEHDAIDVMGFIDKVDADLGAGDEARFLCDVSVDRRPDRGGGVSVFIREQLGMPGAPAVRAAG